MGCTVATCVTYVVCVVKYIQYGTGRTFLMSSKRRVDGYIGYYCYQVTNLLDELEEPRVGFVVKWREPAEQNVENDA